MEGWLGVENMYDADPRLARHFEQALRAHALYKRDRDYIVKDGEIVIVDEFTGRQMPGRRWSEGLHQAIEAKEGLRVQRESVTLATITFQNYFRLYDKLSGMTGTAMTEAEELHKIYKLEVVAIPTHRRDGPRRRPRPRLPRRAGQVQRPHRRDRRDDRGGPAGPRRHRDRREVRDAGRPCSSGAASPTRSSTPSSTRRNRASSRRPAGPGAVTIATNMAGRGTDILLGGNPAGLASETLHKRGINPAEVDPETYETVLAEAKAITEADHDRVVEAGGLHIIGTERHDSRRIDNQLRGRAGRQGDPGSSRFYLSLEDDLMKRFASERVTGLMERLGLDDDVAIESRLVSRTIESAQSRVEGFNFDIRKRVVEYDDVINKQRETIYAERDKVLHNEDLTETVQSFLDDEVDALVETYLVGEDPDEWNLEGLSSALLAMGLSGDGTSADDLWELRSREAIETHVRDLADERLAAKSAEVGEEDWKTVERLVLIRTIDSLWVEHLTELDDMRRGIGLRGYAQQDPLNEFKREAFQLYDELRGLIRHGVASSIFRVTVTRQPAPGTEGPDPAVAASLAAGAAALTSGNGANGSAIGAGARVPAAAACGGRRVGRAARRTGRCHPATDPRIARRRAGRERRRCVGRRTEARVHPEWRPDRTERSVLVRLGRQVQEVSRTLTAAAPARSETVAAQPRSVVRDVAWLVVAGCVALAALAGYASYRIWIQGQRDDQRPADAIVVMGAAQYDGRPSPVFAARLDHAVSLYLAGLAPTLVVTGGKADGDRTTEAASARAYAIARGVPASAILVEDASRTTRESISGVSKLLRDHHLADRGLRLGSAAHAAGAADGLGRRHHRVGLADHDQPDRG